MICYIHRVGDVLDSGLEVAGWLLDLRDLGWWGWSWGRSRSRSLCLCLGRRGGEWRFDIRFVLLVDDGTWGSWSVVDGCGTMLLFAWFGLFGDFRRPEEGGDDAGVTISFILDLRKNVENCAEDEGEDDVAPQWPGRVGEWQASVDCAESSRYQS